jgi:D-psicose/D-tagatose/L-ribulose 3-epimerase
MKTSACAHIFEGVLSLPEIFKFLSEHGFDAIEILGEPDDANASLIHELREISTLEIACLTACGRPQTGRDLSSSCSERRAMTVSHYKRCIDFAASLDCPYVGVAPSIVGRSQLQTSQQEELAFLADGLHELASYASPRGVQIALEVFNRYTSPFLNSVREAVDFLDRNELPAKLIVDLFHMTTEERDITEALAAGKDRIVSIHLADSNRQGLGRGLLPYDDILSYMRQSSYEHFIQLKAFVPRADVHTLSPGQQKKILEEYVSDFMGFIGGI